jgi:NADH dehydrogenase [ubiquinone] 1 alpha subcomplex assembly factor 1
MSGGLRRALVRAREAVQDLHGQLRADFAPMPSMELYSFGGAADISRFQVTTDRVLGGRTACAFSLKEYAHFTAGCFSGVVDFSDEDPASRGGFAAFRTLPDERVRDVSAFEAFELRVKTDGRAYVANFKCADHSPEQLWQAAVRTPPARWTTLAIPFRDLTLTKRGRVELHQVGLNKETLNGFGILLADGENGPFRFEVQHVRVLRRLDPTQWRAAASAAALPDAAAKPRAELAQEEAQLLQPPPPGASAEEWLAYDKKAKERARVAVDRR